MHHSFLFLSYIYIYNMKHKERGPIMTFAFKKMQQNFKTI